MFVRKENWENDTRKFEREITIERREREEGKRKKRVRDREKRNRERQGQREMKIRKKTKQAKIKRLPGKGLANKRIETMIDNLINQEGRKLAKH